MRFRKTKNHNDQEVLSWDGGYAVIDGDILWIPAIVTDSLGNTLKELHEETGLTRMKFSAILNPDEFRTHLKNIVHEGKEWSEAHDDWSYCIEVKFDGEA